MRVRAGGGHAWGIGVRVVASEMGRACGGGTLDVLMWAFGLCWLCCGIAPSPRGAAMSMHTTIGHRRNALWIARHGAPLSGLALACFLPLHFLALGLAIEARRGSTAS
jgi:hypothetical protein